MYEDDFYTTYNATFDFNEHDFVISGVENINYKNTTGKKLDEIYMNIYINNFKKYYEYSTFNINSLKIFGKETKYTINNTFLCIELNEPLSNNDFIEIEIQFDVSIPKTFNNNIVWAGNIMPLISVYDNYGWNKNIIHEFGDYYYNDISNYNITINTPYNYTVVSTGKEESNIVNGINTTNIIANSVRDFAFVISKGFDVKSVISNNILINLYYYTDDENKAEHIINSINDIMKYYVENIGIYPYDSIDIVECNLNAIKDLQFSQLSLIDETFFTDKNIIIPLSLNLAYQWFDGVLSGNYSNEPWLKEGINYFLKNIIYYKNNNIDAIFEDNYINIKESIINLDNNEINKTVYDYKTIYDYEMIQIKKSSIMIYALYKIIGEEKFFDFVNCYYTDNIFKNVTSNDFFRTAEKVYGKSLYDFFDNWINENGIPRIDKLK